MDVLIRTEQSPAEVANLYRYNTVLKTKDKWDRNGGIDDGF